MKLLAVTLFSFLYTAAAQEEHQSVQSVLDAANKLLATGRAADALPLFSDAIKKDPQNYLSYFKRATAYLTLTRNSAALSDFDKVLSIKSDFKSAILQRGKLQAKMGNWEAALKDLVEVPEGNTLTKDIQTARDAVSSAQMHYGKGEAELCIRESTQAIGIASAASSLRLLRARCHIMTGNVDEAIGDLVFATRLNPADPNTQMLAANLFFFSLHDSDRAMQQVKTCLHYDPDAKLCKQTFKSMRKTQKQFDAIRKSMDSRNWISAKNLLKDQNGEGLIKQLDGQLNNLITEKVLNDKCNFAIRAEVEEIACEVFTEAKHNEASRRCDESLRLSPNSIVSLCSKAKLALQTEEYDEAIRILNKANELTNGQDKRVQELMQNAQRLLKVSKQKDYYKVLGVSRDAHAKDIKKAYRKLTKLFHPDKYHGDLNEEQVIRKIESINEAYEVLSDAELRQRFDNGDDPNAPPDQQHNPFQHHGGRPVYFQQAGAGAPFGGFPFGQQGGGQQQHHFKFQF